MNVTRQVRLKILAPVGCIAFLLFTLASHHVSAQSGGEVQVTGGVSTTSFTTPQGKIQVHVSSDAAPGDTISGVVLAEPAGGTPQEQEANLGTLTGLVVELEGQQTKVSTRQYEWTVPAALRVGRAMLTLRASDGRIVSQAPVPIDPQPPLPRSPGSTRVELPSDVQLGRPTTIRAPLDGTLRGKAVEVGGGTADLLASSPRQIVFRVTKTPFGEVPIRFTDNGMMTDGTVRAIGVRLTATNTQLVKGQRATLTTTVTGLAGIREPATLSFRNLSPAVVQLEGGAPRVAIEPRDVRADGTFVHTLRLTGVLAGGFQITASVSRPPLSRFDVPATINNVVAAWQARAQFTIAADARELIQRSVLEARRPLEEFLRQQELNGADAQTVFRLLLVHYCYDLRDNRLSSVPPVAELTARQPVMLAALRQQPAASPEVTANEVRRWSFSQFLSNLVARASASQAIGYLLVTSSPDRAGITIDGQRKSEVTNRRFVTSVGKHDVQVARPSKPCRVSVAIDALQTSVVACE